MEFDDIELSAIRRFLTIVETGSINAAAQRLHIAQPPLSRQMKQLELRLGVRLFDRGKRSVRLTEAGKLMHSRAAQLLGLLGNTIQEMREIDAGTQGKLSIGTVTSSGATLLPQVARLFRLRYPGVTFQLWEGETSRILELLGDGSVEIGMVRYPFDLSQYDALPLPNEPLVVAVHRSRRKTIASKAGQVSLRELTSLPLLIHRKYETMIREQCEAVGFTPTIVCMSDDVTSILTWADADIGLAIVPRAANGLIPSANLDYLTIVDPGLETTAAVIWLKTRVLSAAARNFLREFSSLYLDNTNKRGKQCRTKQS